jgi:hypothetical protein
MIVIAPYSIMMLTRRAQFALFGFG